MSRRPPERIQRIHWTRDRRPHGDSRRWVSAAAQHVAQSTDSVAQAVKSGNGAATANVTFSIRWWESDASLLFEPTEQQCHERHIQDQPNSCSCSNSCNNSPLRGGGGGSRVHGSVVAARRRGVTGGCVQPSNRNSVINQLGKVTCRRSVTIVQARTWVSNKLGQSADIVGWEINFRNRDDVADARSSVWHKSADSDILELARQLEWTDQGCWQVVKYLRGRQRVGHHERVVQ